MLKFPQLTTIIYFKVLRPIWKKTSLFFFLADISVGLYSTVSEQHIMAFSKP